MSKMQAILEELRKLNNDPNFSLADGEPLVMGLIDEDKSLTDFIDSLRHSEASDEPKIISDFKNFEQLKKDTLVEMMVFVVKMAEGQNTRESEKQGYWLAKLRENL
jgi:hypothetical protein